MKRIQYHSYGGPEVMKLEEFQPRQPQRDEVLVRVRAASVNPADWKIRRGSLRFLTGRKFPRAMGTDFSGIVEAVGPSVRRVGIGDEVFGTTAIRPSGAFAEVVVTDEGLVAAKPLLLSFEEAAALPLVGTTAWQGLVEMARLQPGQSVFVHGCLGGIGRAVVQIARARGAAHIAGSCRSTSMREARQTGLDSIFDFGLLDPAEVKQRFDVVFDTTGLLSFDAARSLLNRGGTILDVVATPTKILRTLLDRSYKLIVAKPTFDKLTEVVRLANNGQLRPVIGGIVSMGQAISAITEFERFGSLRGKLVVMPGGPPAR